MPRNTFDYSVKDIDMLSLPTGLGADMSTEDIQIEARRENKRTLIYLSVLLVTGVSVVGFLKFCW